MFLSTVAYLSECTLLLSRTAFKHRGNQHFRGHNRTMSWQILQAVVGDDVKAASAVICNTLLDCYLPSIAGPGQGGCAPGRL